jgi:hypothetical protein
MLINHVSALGIFVIILVAVICAYWSQHEMDGRGK